MGILHDLYGLSLYGLGLRDGRSEGQGLRPCEVDGKPGLFHGWARYDEERLQINYFAKSEHREEFLRAYRESGVLDASGHIVKVAQIAALVEYPDGSVGRVQPELITFLDRRAGHE